MQVIISLAGESPLYFRHQFDGAFISTVKRLTVRNNA